MLKNLLLLLTIFTCTSLSAQSIIWDGGGDGTSWEDALNWSNDTIPLEGAAVIFPKDVVANVTGSAPNTIDQIIFDTSAMVTLDLDLDLGVETTILHNMVLRLDANVTFGGITDMRTFNFLSAANRNSLLLNSEGGMVTVTEQATLNMNTGRTGIRMNRTTAAIINNGTLNLVNYFEHGIFLIRGTITNNGTISIGTGTVDEAPTSDGINVGEEGVFNNNTEGAIAIDKPLDDGLEILGIFNNAGMVSTVSKDDAIAANHGLLVGDGDVAGVVNNLAGAIINTDGGIGESSRTIAIPAAGLLNNAGNINVSGGNLGQALFNLGTLTNETCGQINFIEARILNTSAGMIINNGLITSTRTGSGINNTAMDGSVLNNAFYSYTNPNSNFTTNVEGTDNGQRIIRDSIVVDAANTCMVADIGIDVPYTWYSDLAATIEAGTNDASGLLSFNDNVFSISGTQTLYTCYGEEVQLVVENVSGGCTVLVGVDFVQLTDAFTLKPNPAQDFTQINFGEEYISAQKTIEVYNAVGQLVQTANSSGIDNYLLTTSNLAAGFYTVNLQTEKGMQIERLVIQK